MTRIEEINRMTAAIQIVSDTLYKMDMDQLDRLDVWIMSRITDMVGEYAQYIRALSERLQ